MPSTKKVTGVEPPRLQRGAGVPLDAVRSGHDEQDRGRGGGAELGDVDREILVLRHFEELSNQEAAAELGISEAAATKRHARALTRLGDVLTTLEGDGA